jgi:membrane protease YdiL (CAAX protease family)
MRLSPTPRAPRLSRAQVFCAVYGGCGLFAIAWGAYRGSPDVYRLPGVSTPARLVMSPLIGLAFGLAMVFLSRFAVHRMEWARALHREFHAVVHELTSKEIFLLAIASSVGEELLFRGALLPVAGLIPQAAVFALLHVRWKARFLPWTAMSFVMGLALGGLFLTLGDLGAPIAAHFTINLLNLNYIARTELRA